MPRSRTVRLHGESYLLRPIGPGDPPAIAAGGDAPEAARPFDPDRWVLGLALERADRPGDPLGFYAVAWSTDPECLDDTVIFVRAEARGRRLSLALVYGVYLELLDLPRPFRLREAVDHPRLRLHARCGFAAPIRRLVEGRAEIGRFDLHTLLSRIESEVGIEELPGPVRPGAPA